MTTAAQQQQHQQPAPVEVGGNIDGNANPALLPPAKRARLDGNNVGAVSDLRTFVAQQIRHHLGEDEPALVDLIVSHCVVVAGLESGPLHVRPDVLLPELRDVLDEDAEVFIDALQRKVQELNDSSS